MHNKSLPDRRPAMIYWVSVNGTIFRAESENADRIVSFEGGFAEPFSRNRIVGRNLFQFIAGAEIGHLYRALTERVLKTGHTINFEYRCDSPGTRRDMNMELSRDQETVRYKSVLMRELQRERELPWQTPGAPVFVAICGFCQNYRYPVASADWKELEGLLMESDLPDEFSFTHGICEKCFLRMDLGHLSGDDDRIVNGEEHTWEWKC